MPKYLFNVVFKVAQEVVAPTREEAEASVLFNTDVLTTVENQYYSGIMEFEHIRERPCVDDDEDCYTENGSIIIKRRT